MEKSKCLVATVFCGDTRTNSSRREYHVFPITSFDPARLQAVIDSCKSEIVSDASRYGVDTSYTHFREYEGLFEKDWDISLSREEGDYIYD